MLAWHDVIFLNFQKYFSMEKDDVEYLSIERELFFNREI
jgi:hypothetical protein